MTQDFPTAIITGGAKRIGKQVARALHAAGHNIVIHYRSSASAAHSLADEFNSERSDSALLVAGDLLDTSMIPKLIDAAIEKFGRLDVLVNNASTFYPTPIELIADEYWNDLLGSNLKAPAFMVKHATPHLRAKNGCIVNIVDIYARRPLPNHPIYCAAKAGLEMLTKSLARDLAPQIRVNAVAPGAILWPEEGNSEIEQADLIQQIPLARMGEAEDIGKAVKFLVCDAPYITGQTIVVDGGRSVVS